MLTVENTTTWLVTFTDKITQQTAYLSELDQAIGDGDHGSNMARGTTAMKAKLENTAFTSVSELFKVAAMTLISTVGGASGPLYGSAFLAMSKQAEASTEDVPAIIKAGLEGIQKRGKAERGEKTMVDVWAAALDALDTNTLTHHTIEEAVHETKHIQATKGRAAYLADRSVGHLDPGAVSTGYLFEAMLEGDIIQ
ncbi:dihydroxyacetone kinase subunit DhaL [Lentibacillus saliphilus]|uniref:dihydroxyacetone kinase subunit DhaL n=1 Tax=Lentibacillus saliphilus TaxID=2737028 RepID=UPI001C306911|nr:dihydroxyacetone kinase subunit DhaL [Lentibacillus saliphilus]